MNGFPSSIVNAGGVSVDARESDLTQEEIDTHFHLAMAVVNDCLPPIGAVWLLKDNASFAALSTALISLTVSLLQGGCGILMLSCRAEVSADVRDGHLGAVELAHLPSEELGRA
jgi:hypothetical protein